MLDMLVTFIASLWPSGASFYHRQAARAYSVAWQRREEYEPHSREPLESALRELNVRFEFWKGDGPRARYLWKSWGEGASPKTVRKYLRRDFRRRGFDPGLE